MRPLLVLCVLAAVAACGRGEGGCATPGVATPLDHATTGTIAGTATLSGAPPPMGTVRMTGECASRNAGPVPTGDALVHDGRVENVFVYVKDGLAGRTFAPPDTPVTIDQAGCLYRPHVAGAQTCQPIEFVNSDPFLHNVHGMPHQSAAWNFGMSVQGSRRSLRIDKPDVMVDIRCDVHPWMHAYIGVLDHPYFAVTGPDGRFKLADVPPGDYVVAAWHERFGAQEAHLTLAPKDTKEISFTFAAR